MQISGNKKNSVLFVPRKYFLRMMTSRVNIFECAQTWRKLKQRGEEEKNPK